MTMQIGIQPTLETVQDVLSASKASKTPKLVPVYASLSSEFLTPSSVYLKVSADSKSRLSFLFESAATTETIGRYSFIGTDPRKVLKTGPGHGPEVDPMPLLTEELSQFIVANIAGLTLPPLTGGAIGYVGYDCVKYFEPKTKRDLKDILKVPESLFMFFDTVIAFDHFFQSLKIITYMRVPENPESLSQAYDAAVHSVKKIAQLLRGNDVPLPHQQPVKLDQQYSSNIGQTGYEGHVRALKRHISRGDIIQAVPSQRVARPTAVHPFNVYRQLRTVNPSPYLIFIDCKDFQIVGASPEVLVKSEAGRIITHPIAGTVKRGKNAEEDETLAESLRQSFKDRAEHVMLVDLARNDVNRVCDPLTTRVDRFMVVQKFSHVQHLVSEVSGVLRPEKTRFDAFRSIFPAGTVSGAPKVRAMELIAELEKEKRGIYAGAVGYFGYDSISREGKIEEGAMDTCISLRTMMVKDGVAYLQAGGGIVFDSDANEEWEETINKLQANMRCIKLAEQKYFEEQQRGEEHSGINGDGEELSKANVHVDMAAG